MKRTTRLTRSSPLPRGETPIKKRNAKRKGHRFPKGVDEAFRDWIRGLRCVALGCGKFWLCSGAVECAHVKSRGAGGQDVGNCVPLCAKHHAFQHATGIKSFQADTGLDLAAIAAKLAGEYSGSAHPGAPTPEKEII